MKYLFDLCPIVVGCPSSRILANWYSSDNPELQNPFVVTRHQWGNVRITRCRAREAELGELRVKALEPTKYRRYVTADKTNVYYQYDIQNPNADSMAIQVGHLVQTCVSNHIRELYDSPNQIDSFIKSLQKEVAALSRAYSISCNRVSSRIRRVVEESKPLIESIRQFHITSLLRELKQMNFMENISNWLGSKTSLSESLNSLQDEILHARALVDIRPEKLFDKYLKKFMNGEDKKDQERKSCELLCSCLVSIQKEVDTYITSDLSNNVFLRIKSEFNGLKNEFRTICKLFSIKIEHIVDTDEIKLVKTGEIITLKPKITQGIMKQIIQLGEYCYALFATSGFTYISKFLPNNSMRMDIEECTTIADEDCFIAWGSDLQRFVLFQNTNKTAYFGAVGQTRQFDRGIAIPVYSDRNTMVKSAIYQSKKKKLIYIDQDAISIHAI